MASMLPVMKNADYKSMAKIVLVILLASMHLLLPGIALSEDTPFCSFAGIVEFNGADVADGTVITATVEGDEYTTTTPTGYGASTYAIVIQTPSGKHYPEGAEVAFEINNYAAAQTGNWQPGQNIRLDLTVSTASIPAASPTSTWLIFALVIACIAEVSVVGAVAYIVVRRWNGQNPHSPTNYSTVYDETIDYHTDVIYVS